MTWLLENNFVLLDNLRVKRDKDAISHFLGPALDNTRDNVYVKIVKKEISYKDATWFNTFLKLAYIVIVRDGEIADAFVMNMAPNLIRFEHEVADLDELYREFFDVIDYNNTTKGQLN